MTDLLNQIHLADCHETLQKMPAGSVDLFLQDMPYGVTKNDWDKVPDLAKMWKEWLRVGKENAAFVFTGQFPFTFDLIASNRKMFRYDLIWEKSRATGFLNANRMPLRSHEHILVFYKKLPTFNPQFEKGKGYFKKSVKNGDGSNYGNFERKGKVIVNSGYRFPKSIVSTKTQNNSTIHGTQKPTDLFQYLIRSYSNPGDLVFDGYSGSGTTAIAAEMEGRKWVCCENDPEIHTASVERLNNQPIFTEK